MSSRKTPSRRKNLPLDRFFGIVAAAERIGVPASTLKCWLHRGYLPRIKLPGLRGRVLIKESDLAEFLESHREPARAEIEERLMQAEESSSETAGAPSPRRKKKRPSETE